MTRFLWGVASGDPLTDSVVLWTRLEPEPDPIAVSWILATDADLREVVQRGTAEALAERDGCVHVVASGLEPDTTYHYAFEARGERSPVARTRTLPATDATRLRFGMASCAKFDAGFFNGYARLADRDDLQFVLHLGDYIYEAGRTPAESPEPGEEIGREFHPQHECVTLADYRARYAQYRSDPDVQRMHHAHPLIAAIDDHELADGAWRDGSNNHRPERDGPWSERRAAAFRARWEWLPTRMPDPADPERIYRRVPVAGLADLLVIDTRSRRDQPGSGGEAAANERTQLGEAQRTWLLEEIERSTARWRILGNSSVLGPTWQDDLDDSVKPALRAMKLMGEEGDGPDLDQWDGYPGERAVILDALGDRRDSVVLSGDIHVGMASELRRDPLDAEQEPVTVEFVTVSSTSPNLGEKMGWAPRTQAIPIERSLVSTMAHLQWCELDSHGYLVVDVDWDRVRVEWWFVETVLERTPAERLGAAWEVEHGRSRLVRG